MTVRLDANDATLLLLPWAIEPDGRDPLMSFPMSFPSDTARISR